jgi:DNA-binding transcriptional MerR regulator
MEENRYPEELVRKLFRVSRQTIRNWRKRGLLPPSDCKAKGYSFPELLSIKVITKLKREGVRVGKIEESVKALKYRYPNLENPLIEKTLFLQRKEICFFVGSRTYEAKSGQGLLFKVTDFEKDLQRQTDRVQEKAELKDYKLLFGTKTGR